MKKAGIIFLLTFAFSLLAAGQQKLTFMPNWTPQAQFAGFYVAKEKGFYADQGLDLTVKHINGGSSRSVIDYLVGGEADICSFHLISSMIEKGRGKDIVNVLQLSQNSSLMLVSHTPLNSFQDLNGMKISRWKTGYYEVAEIFCHDYKLNVKWIQFLTSMNLFLSGAVDATLCLSYNEYLNLLFSMGQIPEEQTLRFSEIGYNFPEDGVYTTREFYENNRAAVEKFNAATKQGWEYARDHRDEALDIVMKYVKENKVATNRIYQGFMLDEILNLQVNKESRKVDYEKVDETMFNILNDSLFSMQPGYTPFTYKEFIK